MNDLKPCPFCGGEALLTCEQQVWCLYCGATTRYYDTDAEAIEAWNTRHERTCRIEKRHGDWCCTECNAVVGTDNPESEICIDGNAIELWNFCPDCGAKVVGE